MFHIIHKDPRHRMPILGTLEPHIRLQAHEYWKAEGLEQHIQRFWKKKPRDECHDSCRFELPSSLACRLQADSGLGLAADTIEVRRGLASMLIGCSDRQSKHHVGLKPCFDVPVVRQQVVSLHKLPLRTVRLKYHQLVQGDTVYSDRCAIPSCGLIPQS